MTNVIFVFFVEFIGKKNLISICSVSILVVFREYVHTFVTTTICFESYRLIPGFFVITLEGFAEK